MAVMTDVKIIIPVNSGDHQEIRSYYKNILLFDEVDDLLYLPINNRSVALLIMNVSSEEKPLPYDRRQLPIFSFELDKNFVSFCLEIYKRGAMFDMACRHPGGYYARIFDPAGNQLEIWCSSEDDDGDADPFEMPFFYTY